MKLPETDMTKLDNSDLSNVMVDYTVDPMSTDAGGDQKEYTYQTQDWDQNLGYYKTIPELKTAIDTKARWTVGAGFIADEPTSILLSSFNGNGKDTFNGMLNNLIRTYSVAGDSYAEIIVDSDGVIVNLKPLDPSSMVIVHDSKGRVLRYEQVSKVKGEEDNRKRFSPDKILHLSRERIADEIHGISVVESVEWIIKARNEAMDDWKKVLHRNIQPVHIYHLDTDDETVIKKFKAKTDAARGNGENIYIPKGAVELEQDAVAANSSLNPLNWINQLNDYFFQAVNVPQIIIGNAKEFTDASGKIVYLSYEQSVKSEQLYIEEQILAQLNIEIQLNFPASLQNELISSREKDPNLQASQPNDVNAELEGQS